MKSLKEIQDILPHVLEIAGLGPDDYLIVGSAAEFLAGLGTQFGDIDILVSEKSFNNIIGKGLSYELGHETRTPTRVIKIGLVDIIEHKGKWLGEEKAVGCKYPRLSNANLIEWRLEMGRPKDQLKAWRMIYVIGAPIRELILSDPPLSALNGLLLTESMLFDFQTRLMEMGK